MSHEIRTPLNAIIGFTDLLSISNLNQTQKQYLSIILKSANSLLELLNEILDFAKIETGNIKLHIEKIDLFELIEQVKEIIQFKAQTKGIKVFIIPFLEKNCVKYLYIERGIRYKSCGRITFSDKRDLFGRRVKASDELHTIKKGLYSFKSNV